MGKNLKHCDICGKGFAKQNHVDRHRVVHSKPNKRKPSDKKRTNTKLIAVKSNRVEKTRKSTNNFTNTSITIENANIKQENSISHNNQSANTTNDQDELSLLNSAAQVSGGRLQCPICPRTLSHRKILRLHIRSHLGLNLSHCKVCNRGFAKGSNLNRHMLLHCQIDRNEESRILESATQKNGCYSCPYCAKTLIDRQTFRLHIRLHISKTLLRCEICNRGFDNDMELEKHMTCHGNEFPCNKCDQVFRTYGERTVHISTVHIDQSKFERTERINRSSSSGKTKASSNDATVDADEEDDEDKHIVEKSECVNGRYECVFCKKSLANRTTLKYHIR